MAKSTITITPTTNIKDGAVVDNRKVTKETHDSRMKMFTFYNVNEKETRKGNLIEVSLYNDHIVRDNVQYKILQMLTK